MKVHVEYEGVKSVTYRLELDDLKKAIAAYVRIATKSPDMTFAELRIDRDDKKQLYAEIKSIVRQPIRMQDTMRGEGKVMADALDAADTAPILAPGLATEAQRNAIAQRRTDTIARRKARGLQVLAQKADPVASTADAAAVEQPHHGPNCKCRQCALEKDGE